jgi:anti-sigma factor RsiW
MPLLPRLHPADEDLVALVDGELTLPERVAVERHLAGCVRCAGTLARIERALQALAAELAHEPVSETAPAAAWRLNPAVPIAGAGVLAGSVGALLVAGMLMRRHARRAAGAA